jgi:hypothetical protein
MTAWMIWLISVGGYSLGTMVTARALHIKHSKALLRWKNEAPNKQCSLYRDASYGGGGSYYKERKEVELYDFIRSSKGLIGEELTPRGMAFFWPFFAPVWAVNKFCFPEVKIPDQAKIDELENL